MEEESRERSFCCATEEYLEKKKHEADTEHFSTKPLKLPLARIRRLMKVEENANHIASEVLFLYSKVTEVFIEVLTMKAWKSTEADGRRIIQFTDLARAIKSTDTYDFLRYILSLN